MVDKKKLRLSSNNDEILANLATLHQEKSVLTIWQHPGEGQEIATSDGIISCIVNQRLINFEIINSPQTFKINTEIFFLIKEHDILFKCMLNKQNLTVLQTSLPENMRLVEKRSDERVKFKITENKGVEVSFSDRNAEAFMVSTNLLNISEHGACIIVSKDTLAKLDPKKPIELNTLCKGLLFKKAKAILKNARKFKSKSMGADEMFAVGMEFVEKEKE